jgi:hypothetical protein
MVLQRPAVFIGQALRPRFAEQAGFDEDHG